MTAAALLTACTPERRLQRLLRKHPELARVDTVMVMDTVIVPGDTLWRPVLLRKTDTVTVTSERQVVRLVRVPVGSPCDTAAIRLDVMGEVPPDTVYREVSVPVQRVVPCPQDGRVSKWWRSLAMVFGIFALSLFLLYRYPPSRDRD